ncbi:MAG: response regulator [Anaeromyxobacter sp.]
MEASAAVLAVDDDPAVRAQLALWLEPTGVALQEAESGEAALALLEALTPAVILLDLELPGLPGLEVLRRLVFRLQRVPVVVLTAHREAEVAVECLKAGAYDYLTKPLEQHRLLATVANALRHHELASALARLAPVPRGVEGRPAAAARSRSLDRAMAHDVSVLLRCRAGEGEGAARAIHAGSSRAGGPFERLDCRAAPPEDHAAALFGAGAGGVGKGLVAEAAGGTLFVDGLELLSPAAQAGLAAAVASAGGERAAPEGGPAFRLVCATSARPEELVRNGRLRRDLFMRAGVLVVELAEEPASREEPAESLRLADLERRAVLQALERAEGNRSAASRDLGISRATLYRRLKDLGIE